jgi:hypothetical protein
MDGHACYDSDTSSSNGHEHDGNGDASDNDDASLDYISSSVGDAPAVGGVDIEMVVLTAGAELVFAIFKTLFGSNQDSALADFIRCSVMLHYNNSKRASEAAEA